MIKFKALAFIAAGLFVASSVFAGGRGCCAGTASNNMKASCEATFANLDLTPAQKGKMEKLAAECVKDGCNRATMTRMEKGAKGVLSKEQFAAWKAACSSQMGEKTQS